MLVEALDDTPKGLVGGGADYIQGQKRQGWVVVRGERDTCDDAESAAASAAEGPEEIFVLVGVCCDVGSLGVLATPKEGDGWR